MSRSLLNVMYELQKHKNFTCMSTFPMWLPRNIRKVKLINMNISKLDGLPYLPALKSMYLNHGNIQAIKPGAFKNTTSLEFLHLSYNKIQSVERNGFQEITKLYGLNLQHNNIQYIEPGSFREMNKLNYLYLKNNNITG